MWQANLFICDLKEQSAALQELSMPFSFCFWVLGFFLELLNCRAVTSCHLFGSTYKTCHWHLETLKRSAEGQSSQHMLGSVCERIRHSALCGQQRSRRIRLCCAFCLRRQKQCGNASSNHFPIHIAIQARGIISRDSILWGNIIRKGLCSVWSCWAKAAH